MRKNLPLLIFAAALFGNLLGNALGYAIWQSQPPSQEQIVFQKAVAESGRLSRQQAQANERWCNEVSAWLASANRLQTQ